MYSNKWPSRGGRALHTTACYAINKPSSIKNIARGTTDPEIDSVTGIKFGNNMALLP